MCHTDRPTKRPLGASVEDVTICLWDDDVDLERTGAVLREVGAGPAEEADVLQGYDDFVAMAVAFIDVGAEAIRRHAGWWMYCECQRLRLGLDAADPRNHALTVSVGTTLAAPVLPMHIVIGRDPALGALVGQATVDSERRRA